MSRRLVSRDVGRTEVLHRAATAIAERGYHGMSMRDLARSTGRGLASFYHLFRSKEDILFELQQRAFLELCATAEASLASSGQPSTRLHLFIENHVRFVVEQPDIMRVLVQEASALPPSSRAVIRSLKLRYFEIGERLVGAVGGGADTGDVEDPLEIERATYCMFGMLNWIFGWYEPARHGTPTALAKTIFDVIVSGIAGGRR